MQNSTTSSPRCTSPLASGRVLPCSRLQRLGQLVHVAVQQAHELHQHPRAALRVGRGPCRLRRGGRVDRGVELVLAGQRDLRLHLAGRGVEDVGGAAARARPTRSPPMKWPISCILTSLSRFGRTLGAPSRRGKGRARLTRRATSTATLVRNKRLQGVAAMQVHQILRSKGDDEVVTVQPDITVAEAARSCRDDGSGR